LFLGPFEKKIPPKFGEPTNEITLFWTPASCGIEGNEQAAEAAKNTLEKPVDPNMEMTPSDLIGEASRKCRKIWQEEWEHYTSPML
jgi:hypothetical protein